MRLVIFLLLSLSVIKLASSEDGHKRLLPENPLYMSDVDLERLYDQWEESDEERLPADELPAHRRPAAQLARPAAQLARPAADSEDEMRRLLADPERLMRASKKGKTVMAFVTVANRPSKQQTEALTQRWQVGLSNNHLKCERFVVADDRAIFVFEDGALAFEAKEFLLEQPELRDYSIDNRVWQGKGHPTERPPAGAQATARSGPDNAIL